MAQNRVLELESMVLMQLLSNSPYYTGNLRKHITPLGLGHIRISAPDYKITGKKRDGGFKYEYTHKPIGKTDLMHYAMLLNEVGAFGTGRNAHWCNIAVYNACVMYANQIGATVINKLPL